MDANLIQDEFPIIEEMNEQERQRQFDLTREHIYDELQNIGVKDQDINEAILGIIKSMNWLKAEHEKEGSIVFQYKKKKNVRDAAQANVTVKATYKQIIDEDENSVLTKLFLDKEIAIAD